MALNGVAAAVGEAVVGSGAIPPLVRQVQRWTAREGPGCRSSSAIWMVFRLALCSELPASWRSLPGAGAPELEQRHRILLRDCRSFHGLGERWLRIGLQTRRSNRRIVEALRRVQSTRLPSRSTKR